MKITINGIKPFSSFEKLRNVFRLSISANDNHIFNSTMPLNMPTSREYGHFTLTTSRYSSSTTNSPRNGNLDSGRYTSNGEKLPNL